MGFKIKTERGAVNRGNWYRIKECMKRAQKGESIKIGFLGGSITQGSLSSTPKMCYAYLVYEWWRKTFRRAEFTYINAGIGGTTSQFGVSRVEEHLMKYEPDFTLIEFAVNDDNTEFFKETYEGLIRKVWSDKCKPAVLLMNNVRYNDGLNAEEMHLDVAEKYNLPFVLLSDPDLEAIQAYGVWQEKKLYGKVSFGVVRTTFIIDENGIIEKVMPKVKPDTNAQEILEFL